MSIIFVSYLCQFVVRLSDEFKLIYQSWKIKILVYVIILLPANRNSIPCGRGISDRSNNWGKDPYRKFCIFCKTSEPRCR